MIDTLMMAYTAEMVSVEKVIACAQRYSAFFQATDLPYDIEDAVMYWINKVGAHTGPRCSRGRKASPHSDAAPLRTEGLCPRSVWCQEVRPGQVTPELPASWACEVPEKMARHWLSPDTVPAPAGPWPPASGLQPPAVRDTVLLFASCRLWSC